MHNLMARVDNELEKNNLISHLQGIDEDLANAMAAEESLQTEKLRQRREVLRQRRKNKQVAEVEEARVTDKIAVIEEE